MVFNMIEIIIYKTTSPKNYLTKTLTDSETFQVKLKDSSNIINPFIMLKSEHTLYNFNYVYIPVFNRYYYINSIKIEPNNIYLLDLTVDVLMSFRNDILASTAKIIEQANYLPYLNTATQYETRKESFQYESNVSIEPAETLIILTLKTGE